MKKPKVFIDGSAGTTGLQIRQRLVHRKDLEVHILEDHDRKSDAARKNALESADLAILCLPDDAARIAAKWAEQSDTRVLDASSNHRVADGWVYGLPELVPEQRNKIKVAERVANPGCYDSAFILLVRPLVDAGLLSSDIPISVHALSGYSGGGRSLIERWESEETGLNKHVFEAPYAVDWIHKHIPEMQHYSGLSVAPQFIPAVGPFASGMRVQLPLHQGVLGLNVTGEEVWRVLSERYRDDSFVEVAPLAEFGSLDEWTLDPTALNGTNLIRLYVFANPAGHLLLFGILDNLGKGASGVAIQAVNLMLGLKEDIGLL